MCYLSLKSKSKPTTHTLYTHTVPTHKHTVARAHKTDTEREIEAFYLNIYGMIVALPIHEFVLKMTGSLDSNLCAVDAGKYIRKSSHVKEFDLVCIGFPLCGHSKMTA